MNSVPIRDLKDTAKIEKLCASTKAPVFVTKDGHEKLVVMDMKCFERLMGQAYEARIINKGFIDLMTGKTIDGKAALAEARKK